MNLFLVLFDLIGPNFVEIVSEFHLKGKVATVLNSTFIELTLKGEQQKCFYDYIPIPLCNIVYTIISNIIANRLKPIMS